MDRRKLFSFFGAAPLGAAVALTLKEDTPAAPVRTGAVQTNANGHKCKCGSPAFHYAPKVVEYPVAVGFDRSVTTRRYEGYEPRCLWCQAPWTGPVPKDTVI